MLKLLNDRNLYNYKLQFKGINELLFYLNHLYLYYVSLINNVIINL